MKIGFFTDSYLPMNDGVAISTFTTAQELKQRGHDVYIIAPNHPRYKDKEPKIYRLTSVKFFASEFRLALQMPQKALIQTIKTDFDIIHGHNGGPISFLGWELSRARRIPYILTYHTLWTHYTHYFMKGRIVKPKFLEVTTRLAGNRCDYLIAPTERVKKELISYGIKKPLHVLPTGVDTTIFKNVKKGYLRKKLKIASTDKILLYVGRLGKEKSVDFLINSFQKIHKQNPHTVLVLVGSGAEKEKLKKLAADLDLKNSVYFVNPIKHINIAKVYVDADVFLFASQTETQGMVILESLASGIPVVSLKDDAFKGIIEDKKNGFLVDKNSENFSEKVTTLLSNKTLYKKFSENAINTAEKFSLKDSVSQLEKIYKQMIKEKSLKETKRNLRSFDEFRNFLEKAKMQIKSFEL